MKEKKQKTVRQKLLIILCTSRLLEDSSEKCVCTGLEYSAVACIRLFPSPSYGKKEEKKKTASEGNAL